jgi:hypothetical protein
MTDPHGKFVWYELMTIDTAAAETWRPLRGRS